MLGRNPFGLYLYLEDVDALAREFQDEILGKHGPEDKPWGMYEFALSDLDQTLVRVGWPTRLRRSRQVRLASRRNSIGITTVAVFVS